MKPIVPYYINNGNLDLDEVNENLAAIARDINRNLRKRTTLSRLRYSFDGITNASDPSVRKFYIRRPAANRAVEIVKVELVLYGNAAVTATLACSDTTWPDLTLATSATTTTECATSSSNHVSVPSESADVTFTLSFSGAYTVTNGYIIVHLKCDRGNQGSTHTEVVADQFLSTDGLTGTLGTSLGTALTELETALGYDTANQDDLRCECITIRGEAAGATVAVRLPSGAGRAQLTAIGYNIQAVGGTLTVDVDGDSAVINGAGATTLSTVSVNTLSITKNDDPMDTTDDTVVTLTVAAQTVQLGYVLLWYK